jgi:D-alanine-D-alanine ligase
MPVKKTVAILYGGRSVEHGVSVNSAKNVSEFLDKSRFEMLTIGISRSGQWFLTIGVQREIDRGKALGLLLDPHNPGFILLSSGDRVKVDIVFPVLHGTDGEDGSIQGMLKALDIPMVGTGVLGSAISMNKIVAKRLLQDAGVPVAKFLTYDFPDKDKISYADIAEKVGVPFMVKAASLGSSVGVSKVKKEDELGRALDEAFAYDRQVLVEEYIHGREIECAILGNFPPEASNPGEIIISDKYEFYTFDAKYVDGKAVKIEVPAKLEADTIARIRALSVKAFQVLHGEDFARVDLFVTTEGGIYINEINTIPGFTNSSMYPMMWRERSIKFQDLITRLIQLGFDRHQQGRAIERDFKSSMKF